MQDCGSCVSFTKLKADKFGGGLCERKDARTKSDHGHDCREFERPKHNRLKESRLVVRQIKEELVVDKHVL